MLKEPNIVYDGQADVSNGMDSGRAPSLIMPTQVAMAVNLAFRDSFPQARPGWVKRALVFEDEDAQALFEEARWQRAIGYVGRGGQLLANIGGRVFSIDPTFYHVTDLSATSGESNPVRAEVWWAQAEQYAILQDGQSIPLIFDGASLRRSQPTNLGGQEVATGCMMEYNNGRLWVTRPDRRSFVGGDLAYSVTGTTYDVLTFTENTFLNGGGAFAVSSNAGPISAMRSIAIQDTTTGQGPLQVFTTQGVFSINAPFNREQWQNTDSPIETISVLAAGAQGQYGTVNVNGDIWYRSLDGVRSFTIARRDHGTWVNTPLSREVQRVLDYDDEHLLGFASGVKFDNRLLMTASPYRATETDGTEHGIAHRGLLVLDFAPVSTMFTRSQPTWDGLWTGLNILQIVTLDTGITERCFLFALNSDYKIELWELTTDARFDNTTVPIEWWMESRALGFADQGNSLKRMERAEIWIDRLVGNVDFSLSYRPDSYWSWVDWHSWSKCAIVGACTIGCAVPTFPQEQYRVRMLMPQPDNNCEEAIKKPYRQFFDAQLRLQGTGACRVRRIRAVASNVDEDTARRCEGEETCVSESGCQEQLFTYSSES